MKIERDLLKSSRLALRRLAVKYQALGLIQHGDGGSQYCLYEYRTLVALFSMQASMSRRGNCYDNAPIERFWERSRTNSSTTGAMRHASRPGQASCRQQRSGSNTFGKALLLDTVLAYTNCGRPHCLAWRAFVRARQSKTSRFLGKNNNKYNAWER